MEHDGRPAGQLEVQRRLPEAVETDGGSRFLQDVVVAAGDLQQRRLDGSRVAPVGDADGKMEAHARRAEAPVRDGLRDELGVGNDQVDVVVGPDQGRARTDLGDVSGHLADLDAVADLDRPLDQEDQARHEVLGDVLQAEADAHADRAAEDGERRGIDAQGLERDDQPQDPDQVRDHSANRVADSGVHACSPEQPLGHQAPQEPRNEPGGRDDGEAGNKARQSDLRLPDPEEVVVQDVLHPRGGSAGSVPSRLRTED